MRMACAAALAAVAAAAASACAPMDAHVAAPETMGVVDGGGAAGAEAPERAGRTADASPSVTEGAQSAVESADRAGTSRPKGHIVAPSEAPLPPGAALDISSTYPTPGESFNFNVCTAAYSFTLEDGRSIGVTASHCAREGDLVWAGAADGEFIFPAEPIGEVIHSDLYAVNSNKLDVAFIELNDNAQWATYHFTRQMETQFAAGLDELPNRVCKLGRSTGQTCGEVTHYSQLGRLHSPDGELESSAARAAVCGRTGDSGGPVFGTVDGREVIVGLVSGTTEKLEEHQTCETAGQGMEMSFTTTTDVQHVVEEVLGVRVASYN